MTISRVDPAWPVLGTDFQISLNGLLMGTGTAYGLLEMQGFGLPSFKTADSDRAFAHGAFGGSDFAASRDLIFGLKVGPRPGAGDPVLGVLLANLLDAFGPMQSDVGLSIRVPGYGPLVFIGRPRPVDAPYDVVAAKGTAVIALARFTALDPLKYGATLNDVLIAYGTAGTQAGLPFNAGSFGGMTFQPLRIIQNGGFESAAAGDGGWVTTVATDLAAGATLTRDTGTFDTGVASGKLVTSGGSVNQGVRQPTLTNLLPNTSYTFTVRVNLSTAGGSIRLLARDVTNAVLASSAGVVNATGSWQTLSVTLVTGATGPVQVMLTVRDEGTAVTRTFFVDGVRGDLSSSVQAYAAPLVGVTFGAIGGGAGAAGFQSCVSAGNTATVPVTRIKALAGPVTGPLHLERVESGEVITLNFSLSNGDVLELDHDLRSVTLNGNTNRADIVDVSSAWWVLQPGANTIHYRTDGAGVGSTAEVLWRDASW